MALKIEYIAGPSLEKSYFVATAGDKNVVIRAAHLLDPKLHALANEDTDKEKPKLDVQPEQIVDELQKVSDDLDAFKTAAYNMAAKNASVTVHAAADDAPVVATETPERVKVTDEPEVAMEAGLTAQNVPLESAPKVAKYYARLPKKTGGSPEIALDLQSSIKALEEQVRVLSEEKDKAVAERDDAKSKLDGKMKEGATEGIMSLLSEIGIVEDVKDKDNIKKRLVSLDEKAIGVLEHILKMVTEKQPSKPKAPIAKGPGQGPGAAPKAEDNKPPVFSSNGNIVTSSLREEGSDMSSINQIKNVWMAWDNERTQQVLTQFKR